MAHDVFISHSSKDKLVSDAVCSNLEHAGIRCWMAPRDIRPGDSWGSSIIKGIEDSRVMVIIFSEHANASQQVMREVERAVQKNVVVVPFRIDDVKPTADMEYFLSATHWLDAMTPEMDAHFDKLAATVKSILGGPLVETPTPIPPPAQTAPKSAPAAVHRPQQAAAVQPVRKNKTLLYAGVALVALLLLVFLFLKPSGSDGGSSGDFVTAGDGNIRITLPEKAISAESLEISIKGKTGDKDYITIAKSDASDQSSVGKVNVAGNELVSLELPGNEGLYEIRYFDAANRTIVARQSIKISNPEVTLDAIKEAIAGSNIDVTWKAPNNIRDYLAIAEKDAPSSKYETYAYTKDGSPTNIRVPNVEGAYEIRYISGKDKAIWASRDFKALEPKASVDVPQKGLAGSTIQVKWTGPAVQGDYVSVAEPSSEGGKYLKYQYVKEGQKAELRLPDDPGTYEIRYISGGSKIIRDSKNIQVAAVEVTIDEISDVEAGATFSITVTSPGNPGDYVGLFKSGDPDAKYLSYQYSARGSILQFKAPEEPGNYVMKYISGNQKREWATREFVVKANE